MEKLPSANEQLRALSASLAGRRDSILAAWRRAVDLDPELTTASTITRTQFVDHIPAVLDAFERRLAADESGEKAEAIADQKEHAAEHGLHRWQQGYDLPETMREWGHLHLCLLIELQTYSARHSELRADVLSTAQRALARLCSEGACASATRYAQLQQAEAASRVGDLEAALAQVRAFELERAEAWREAAHDLRGSAQVIANATAVLGSDGVPASKHTQVADILRTSVASLNQLLVDLMDHARLEAGQERCSVAAFDAAAMLREFCEAMRPAAAECNLFLKAEGPDSLPVEGDSVKVRRIVQNLELNAIKVTQRGGVKVAWQESGNERRQQWNLYVQDTGPGFQTRSATPLERALKEATLESQAVGERAQAEGRSPARPDPPPTMVSETARHALPPSGEGIGLAIVKRLCELLDAGLELETAEGDGTTFCVTFPRAYRESAVAAHKARPSSGDESAAPL